MPLSNLCHKLSKKGSGAAALLDELWLGWMDMSQISLSLLGQSSLANVCQMHPSKLSNHYFWWLVSQEIGFCHLHQTQNDDLLFNYQ